MTYYFIDFENTGEAGLPDVKGLTGSDWVVVFYGQTAKHISFDKFAAYCQCPATFQFYKIEKTGKNYLDFQLATFLGFKITFSAEDEWVIVSNDAGFDSVVDFWQAQGITIKRLQSAEAAKPEKKEQQTAYTALVSKKTKDIPKDWRKKVCKAVKKDQLSGGQYSGIYKAIAISTTPETLKNHLVSELGASKGATVFQQVESIYQQYHTQG